MATVINSLEKTVENSQKKKLILKVLIRSLIAGIIGYSIFLLTLAATYPVLYKHFQLGKGQVSGEDLILSSVGFLVLYTTFVIKEMKNNSFIRKSQ